VWIKRQGREVQRRGLWDSPQTINKARPCASLGTAIWENPARITSKVHLQFWLTFVNGLLSFKIPERIVAGLAPSLNEPLNPGPCGPPVDGVAAL
jgi:hypothetical protein